jgi:SMC interacting uncharacterized protein involved in chromosome segregation
MPIQNSRSRKAGRKTMEAEATVRPMNNGIEKSEINPEPVVLGSDALSLSKLMDKREKMLQGLNSIKSDKDSLKEQVAELEERIKRTEGALIMLTSLIQELDPTALQPQGR